MKPLHKEIARTLHYYAYFGHPLSAGEVLKYLRVDTTQDEVTHTLNQLVADKVLVNEGPWYAISQNHIDKRKATQQINQKLMRLAQKMGRLISLFPFVRGAYISGSLSKEGATAGDDIDFFVITSPGRVWSAKLFLILFKKLCLLNSKRYFCINFLKAEDALELSKRNIYIATEVASLVPVYNPGLLGKFLKANPWLGSYFPNFYAEYQGNEGRKWYFWDALFAGKAGDALERWSRKRFALHTRRKLQSTRAHGYYEIGRQTSAFFPHNHEPDILQHYHALHT